MIRIIWKPNLCRNCAGGHHERCSGIMESREELEDLNPAGDDCRCPTCQGRRMAEKSVAQIMKDVLTPSDTRSEAGQTTANERQP